MNDQTEQAEEWSAGDVAFRKALHDAVHQAQEDDVVLSDLLTHFSEMVGRVIASVPGYNDRRAACSIFHCQMVDTLMVVEAEEESEDAHNPETCPDCIAAGGGRTVQ